MNLCQACFAAVSINRARLGLHHSGISHATCSHINSKMWPADQREQEPLGWLKAAPAPAQFMQGQHACLTDKRAHLREFRAALCLADP